MRHFDRKISSRGIPPAYVWRVPVTGDRRWKPYVEYNGSTYLGAYADNVYVNNPRGPGMSPFYFAEGAPEH